MSTIRGTDVAADPTNALALEAAVRRQAVGAAGSRAADPVRLAAVQRVVRAQHVDGPVLFAHFSLFAMVAAGRAAGGLAFERAELIDQLAVAGRAVRALGADGVQARLTVLAPHFDTLAADVRGEGLGAGVDVVLDPDRESGRGYYQGLCFKVIARFGGEWLEVGDGGFVDWTQELLSNRKERLLISGLGVDRLAMAMQ